MERNGLAIKQHSFRPDHHLLESGNAAFRQGRKNCIQFVVKRLPRHLVSPFKTPTLRASIMIRGAVPCNTERSILACKGTQEGNFVYIAHIASIRHSVFAPSPRNNGKIAQATTAAQRLDAHRFCAALRYVRSPRRRHRSRPILPRLIRFAWSFHLESCLSQLCPERPCAFTLLAFELVGHPEQRTVDHGAIIAGQVYDPGLNDEAAEFDQMPRPLATLDLPGAHVMPR
jgi:hypothetical protein